MEPTVQNAGRKELYQQDGQLSSFGPVSPQNNNLIIAHQ
jgi:hypothetical protein